MVTTEERLRVFKMVQEGKLTPEEGVQLLDALEDRKGWAAEMSNEPGGSSQPRGPRWLQVRVSQISDGKPRVNVRIPVGLVTAGIKMGARFAPEISGLDMDEVIRWVKGGQIGQVLNVYDEDDDEHVEVFLE